MMNCLKDNFFKVIGFLILTGLISSGCSPKKSQHKRSYIDDKISHVEPNVKSNLESEGAEQVFLSNLLKTTEPIVMSQVETIAEAADSKLLMEKVITPLRDIVLNVNYLSVKENRYARTKSGRYIMPRLVSLFNNAILLINKYHPDLIQHSDVMKKYKEVLFWDCDQNLRGSCEFIKFFRTHDSVNMGQIVKIIHNREIDEDEKLRLIKTGFELKNRRLDSSLILMLFDRISKSLSDEKMSPRRRRQDSDLFSNMLKIVELRHLDDDEERYKKVIRQLNPWSLSRNSSDYSIGSQSMASVINLIGRYLLYNENGDLSDEMKNDIIPHLLYIVQEGGEQGIFFQRSNIQGAYKERYKQYVESQGKSFKFREKEVEIFPQLDQVTEVTLYGTESQDILNTLLGKEFAQLPDSEQDEYFYLVHKVFYAHFNLEDAAIFWSNTNKNITRLMKEIERIVEYQIINNIVLTNNRMNEFYENNRNASLLDIIKQSEQEASRIHKIWAKAIVRAQSLKHLLNRTVDFNFLSDSEKEKYDSIKSSINAITKNVKFLVTYPNMLPVLHVMAFRRLEHVFLGFLKVESDDVIKFFFRGGMSPWFYFGGDRAKLDSKEIIYTYYYALASQTFETYSTNSVITFSHEEFFKTVVKELIRIDEQNMEKAKIELSQKIDSIRGSADSLQKMCTEEKRIQEQESKAMTEFRSSPTGSNVSWYESMKNHGIMQSRNNINYLWFSELKSLSGILHEGARGAHHGTIGKYISTMYDADTFDTLTSMRKFSKNKILIETIIDVFKNFKDGDHQFKIDDIVKEQFQKYYDLKAEYIKLYTEAEAKARPCTQVFLKRSRDIRHMMIYREVETLSKLFDDIWDTLSTLTEDQRRKIHKGSADGDAEIVEAKEKIESIRKKFGHYTQINNLIGSSQTEFPDDYDDYQERFGYNKISGTQVTLYTMDAMTRVYGYLHELFPGQYVIAMPPNLKNDVIYQESNPKIVYFDWSKNKDEAKALFIEDGIRAFASQIRWAEKPVSSGVAISKGNILVELFKLGVLTKNSQVNCHDEELEESVKLENCVKVTPEEIISHYKSVIDYINIDERDKAILLLLDQNYKYEEGFYETLIKKEGRHELYSIYDLVLKRIFSDSYVKSPESIWFSSTLIDYVKSVQRIDSSSFIFPVPDYINEIFYEKYSNLLKSYVRYTQEFLSALKDQVSYAKPISYSYRLNEVHSLNNEINESSRNPEVNLEPLVSDLAFNKIETLLMDLNDATSGYFLDIFAPYQEEISKIVKSKE